MVAKTRHFPSISVPCLLSFPSFLVPTMLFSGTAYFSHSVAWHVSASKVSNGCRDFFCSDYTEKAPFLQTAKSDTPFTAHILCAKVISGVLDIFQSALFQAFYFIKSLSEWSIVLQHHRRQRPSGKKLEPRLVSMCPKRAISLILFGLMP